MHMHSTKGIVPLTSVFVMCIKQLSGWLSIALHVAIRCFATRELAYRKTNVPEIAFLCTKTYSGCVEHEAVFLSGQHNIPRLYSDSTKQDW